MADNITLNPGTGGATLKTDENASSEHYQVVKLADGTADSDTVIESGSGTAATALRVELPTDGTGKVGLNAGSETIGKVNIGSAGTASGDLAKAEDAASASGDVGVMALAVRADTDGNKSGSDGDFEPLQLDTGRLKTSAAGDVAHGSADSGKPVKMGAKAVAIDGTDPGSVDEGDRLNLHADLNGLLLVSQSHPYSFSASVDYASVQTDATVQAAPGASLSLYVTDLVISNGGTAGNVTLLDGASGTVLFEAYLPVNGHMAHSFRNPLKLTANTLLAVTSTSVTTHAVNVSGYIAP